MAARSGPSGPLCPRIAIYIGSTVSTSETAVKAESCLLVAEGLLPYGCEFPYPLQDPLDPGGVQITSGNDMVCVSTDMLKSLGKVLPSILGDYPLRQDQCLVGDGYGYLVEPLAEKPSGGDILSIDISKLPDLSQYDPPGNRRLSRKASTTSPEDGAWRDCHEPVRISGRGAQYSNRSETI